VSDHHAAPPASSGADHRCSGGQAPQLAPSAPPVLAFGRENLTAVLTELRRRERRPVFHFPACVDHGALPTDGSTWDLDTSCSPGAVSHTTHCKEQS
jgi:hypothetical protein